MASLTTVKPLHVAAYIEGLKSELPTPSVKQHLAALRTLFDWLVVRYLLEINLAHFVPPGARPERCTLLRPKKAISV